METYKSQSSMQANNMVCFLAAFINLCVFLLLTLLVIPQLNQARVQVDLILEKMETVRVRLLAHDIEVLKAKEGK